MLLINFAFFCIALSDAARLDESEKRPSEALWTKLKAYQNATGISNDETMRIWESTKEFAQKSSTRGELLFTIVTLIGEFRKQNPDLH